MRRAAVASCAWHEATGREGPRQRRASRPGARPGRLVALVVAAARAPCPRSPRPRDRLPAAAQNHAGRGAFRLARPPARGESARPGRPRRPLARRAGRGRARGAETRARGEAGAGRARRDPVRPQRRAPRRPADEDALRPAPLDAARRLGRAACRTARPRARHRLRLVARFEGAATGRAGADPAPLGRARPARAPMGRRGVAAARAPRAAGPAAVRPRADARAAGRGRRAPRRLPGRAAPGRRRRRSPAG